MNSTKLSMTAQIPSRFGMPTSGHAFVVSTRATDVCADAATVVVRDRIAGIASTTGAAKADMGLVRAYFPGTSAWRPPTC